MADSKKTIEQAFKEIEDILHKMQDPGVTLEESFENYNKGLELVKYCNESITQIEQKISILEENA